MTDKKEPGSTPNPEPRPNPATAKPRESKDAESGQTVPPGTPPEPREDEIIFSHDVKPETKHPARGPQSRFSFLRLGILLLLVTSVYFAGYMTSPKNLESTLNRFRELASLSREKIAPYREKLTEAIESKVKKKPPETVSSTPGKNGDGPAPTSKRKIKYWRAPMDPTYVRDQPGKSPMGMDLIPVYEDEVESQIKISPTVIQNIGIKTAPVKRRTLKRTIRTVGTLTFDERKVHHIHTKYGGWIQKLHVDFTGQEVSKNDLLMEIYSPSLVSTQEELLLALKYKESLKDSSYSELGESADSLVASTRKRLELFDVPEHQIEELIRNKTITKAMHIHSPVRGFVIKKIAQEGMHVQPGMSLYSIADLSNIWVIADIYEYEVPWIRVGQTAEMSLSYFPGKKFRGKVTFIDPYLDPTTRTLKVRMEFPNPKWELKPDMYANVFLHSTVSKRGLTVPEEAVIHSGEKSRVIVSTHSGKFESRDITLGIQAEGYYQVKRGLKSGEKVVTSSNFLIDSESNLKEAIGKLQQSPFQSGTKQTNRAPPPVNPMTSRKAPESGTGQHKHQH